MFFQGRAMGTCYEIIAAWPARSVTAEVLAGTAGAELTRVEALMSAYLPESDVGRINAAEHGDWVDVSAETLSLIERARRIGACTDGVYDLTAGALVEVWGFGAGGGSGQVPTEEAIEAARRHVGWELIEWRADPPAVRKRDPRVHVDLASIAKGYGVDCAAAALEQVGVANYCVAAGGEVRVRGRNPRGERWRVAVDSPLPGVRTPQRVLALSCGAVATSGDYRIFVEHDGARLPHVLDPRTGRPVRDAAASVTVVSDTCAEADAWATALMAMGAEAGYALAVRENLAAMFLSRFEGGVVERCTPQMIALLAPVHTGR